jgi:hypothetical protein
MSFELGDRVRLLKAGAIMSGVQGQIYTIVAINPDGPFYRLDVDKPGYGCRVESIELVPPEVAPLEAKPPEQSVKSKPKKEYQRCTKCAKELCPDLDAYYGPDPYGFLKTQCFGCNHGK